MRKERFYYNEKTLRYEKVQTSFLRKSFQIMGLGLCVLLISSVIGYTLFNKLPSPQEQALERELGQMQMQHAALGQEVETMSKVLNNIQDRDANVHRVIFGMNPIDGEVWNGGIGGSDKYSHLTKFENSGDLLISTQEKADKLKRQLKTQSESLDKLEEEARKKEHKLACIPAIKPIREDKLKRRITSLSGFGMRMHPIFKRKRMHRGLDFTCAKGTPIQASGAGKIVKVQRKKTGYGTHVIIDHGYGYKSLYAHMASVRVKVGDQVKRGEQIGTVGNTGTSTAAHLHYEVIFKGEKVNPIDFCMDGLSAEEYQSLVDAAEKVNQSMD